MKIYFDNAATTKVCQIAFEKIKDLCINNYGNPSSLHKMGVDAEKEIINTKKIISNILKVSEEEIYFTSGATEANNSIIFGICDAYKRDGKHIITAKSEHSSVVECYKKMEKDGFEVSFVNMINGEIDLKHLEEIIREDTILISFMHVNNETGIFNPIEKIGQLIKRKNPNTIFHVDGVQSFCKFNINIKNYYISAYTFSGHKIYGPKGVGGFYLKKGTKFSPTFFGGHQQKQIRPGTENILGISSLGIAAQEVFKNHMNNYNHVFKLREKMASLTSVLPDVVVNGNLEISSPYIINLSFIGVKGEVLVHALEQDEIFVSTGSACNESSKDAMLYCYDLSVDRVSSAVRFSFSIDNTIEEVELCIQSLLKNVPTLRRYYRK